MSPGRTEKRWSGREDLNLRPPGPELWKYKLQVLYLVSLREQRTSFSLARDLVLNSPRCQNGLIVITIVITCRRSAVVELKVRKFGNSLGVVLPKEVIHRLHTRDGEPLFLIEASEGGYLLTPYDPGFEEKMAKADDIISRYRNTLHVLAK